jgi:hypothetical protein
MITIKITIYPKKINLKKINLATIYIFYTSKKINEEIFKGVQFLWKWKMNTKLYEIHHQWLNPTYNTPIKFWEMQVTTVTNNWDSKKCW